MSAHEPKEPKTLRPEMTLFIFLGFFFAILAVVYASVSDVEPVGTTVFALLVGLSAIIAGYLAVLARRTPPRPSDRLDGEIAETAGEYGTFSPRSWWPLVSGVGAAVAFLGAALAAWWLFALGAIIGILGVAGHVYEFSLGQHAH